MRSLEESSCWHGFSNSTVVARPAPWQSLPHGYKTASPAPALASASGQEGGRTIAPHWSPPAKKANMFRAPLSLANKFPLRAHWSKWTPCLSQLQTRERLVVTDLGNQGPSPGAGQAAALAQVRGAPLPDRCTRGGAAASKQRAGILPATRLSGSYPCIGLWPYISLYPTSIYGAHTMCRAQSGALGLPKSSRLYKMLCKLKHWRIRRPLPFRPERGQTQWRPPGF